MIYPFRPEFSAGLNVSESALTTLLSTRAALGTISPLLGFGAERLGSRRALFIGLAIYSGALTAVALFPLYPVLFSAVILIVLAKLIFDPSLQAYLSERTPYTQRGLVIAFTELGWSGAALIGIPLAGVWIAYRQVWYAPFAPLAFLSVVAGAILWGLLPHETTTTAHVGLPTLASWQLIARSPTVLAALSIGFFLSLANENLTAIYGLWLERDFGLPVVERGATLIVIGLAELAGEGLVMYWADRLGKRRAILIGLALSVVAFLALPLLAFDLTLALIALGGVFITFEFAMVSSIPMMTELLPTARVAAMSANIAGHSLGRMLGVLLGSALFPFGFVWNGLAGAFINLLTLGIVWWWVREGK